jgi:hypothetical protein
MVVYSFKPSTVASVLRTLLMARLYGRPLIWRKVMARYTLRSKPCWSVTALNVDSALPAL